MGDMDRTGDAEKTIKTKRLLGSSTQGGATDRTFPVDSRGGVPNRI